MYCAPKLCEVAMISMASWFLSQTCQHLTVLHDQGDLWESIWHYDAVVRIPFPDILQCPTSCHLQQCSCYGFDNWSAQRWMGWTDEAQLVKGSIVWLWAPAVGAKRAEWTEPGQKLIIWSHNVFYAHILFVLNVYGNLIKVLLWEGVTQS